MPVLTVALMVRELFPKPAAWHLACLLAATFSLNARASALAPGGFSRFIALDNFAKFARSKSENGETVLLSPVIPAGIDWDELVVSWNAAAPSGTFLKVEASAISSDRATRFYSWGLWSPDNGRFPRQSAGRQKDRDGRMLTDTLVLSQPAGAVRIRVTLGGTNAELPALKFLGLSFCNTRVTPAPQPPNHAAWGKIIPTPELSQNSYRQGEGWCSPTALTMVLKRWADVLHRPELNLGVPEVAAGVYDRKWPGTGNWPFNTAFAGSFTNLRAYVTRLGGMSELEDWIAAGIPVIISAPWHLLKPGRHDTGSGHLTVCIGFTKSGDVVINDPATNLKKESVRHIYKRANVIRAWAASHNTVYLVYPESAKIPENRFGHWQSHGAK
ncbi:MAG: peptidase C39 family protein [Verrucomicrobiota bacterium]|nr:peptidase C39 family protein [Verrucomicrobiota bacterium]